MWQTLLHFFFLFTHHVLFLKHIGATSTFVTLLDYVRWDTLGPLFVCLTKLRESIRVIKVFNHKVQQPCALLRTASPNCNLSRGRIRWSERACVGAHGPLITFQMLKLQMRALRVIRESSSFQVLWCQNTNKHDWSTWRMTQDISEAHTHAQTQCVQVTSVCFRTAFTSQSVISSTVCSQTNHSPAWMMANNVLILRK